MDDGSSNLPLFVTKNGLFDSASVKCKKNQCYYVTINSMIREVTYAEILAKEL